MKTNKLTSIIKLLIILIFVALLYVFYDNWQKQIQINKTYVSKIEKDQEQTEVLNREINELRLQYQEKQNMQKTEEVKTWEEMLEEINSYLD